MIARCLAALGMLLASPASEAERPFDLLIVNGTVVDGTGALGTVEAIGVRGERIVYVGSPRGLRARRIIDATGLVVAPGFIDAHNHADESIGQESNRLNENFLLQGVTTVVGGPDGRYSPAELRGLTATFTRNGIGTNYAFYVGHNGIRTQVMGADQRRAPSASELERMKALVREGMEMGALGLSTGLMYEPGLFSTTDEVVALAAEVRPYDGLYDTHTRDPGRNMVASEGEAIEIGRRAHVRVKLGHLKAVGLHNRWRIGEVIAMVNAARSEGLEVVADQYPYDGAQTAYLQEILILPDRPSTAPPPDLAEVRRALRDPARRDAVRQASENGIGGGFSWIRALGYDGFRIVDSPSDRSLEGQMIQLRADSHGRAPFDEIADLILNVDQPILITLGSIDERDVRDLMVQPWVMIASDGSYVPAGERQAAGHPRSTGTFPRVLQAYSRETHLLDLPQAVHRMTGLPADFLRLRDRGRIAQGYAADITMFDPQRISANSTWVRPNAYATGARYVLVNGQLAVSEGRVTGIAAGRVLARRSTAPR